ncbi:hypothetical protein AB0E01_09345 [Nocardia vinacea]|uniref:hypothetical protein n=1 Tax=Nocardia vinacea TaxID=96468 RepID=UPI0033F736AB
MGISPADLVTCGVAVPSFGEVIPKVKTRLSAGTLRTYNTHFEHLLAAWSDHRLDEPTKTDLEEKARDPSHRPHQPRLPRRHLRGAALHQRGALCLPLR